MWVRGRMRQAVVFGENLTLTGVSGPDSAIPACFIRDVVANEGL
jgi:hypothetical protein